MTSSTTAMIEVRDVSKKFCSSLRKSMAYGLKDVLQSLLPVRLDSALKLRDSEFWALEHVDFQLQRGETLGIVGANGSGKSTLLRIINGIFAPDSGEIVIRGRIGSLIALGAGFHPHLTGRENIALNAALIGMTPSEISSRFDSIVAFADIGDFLEAPVATYSSGMTIRLGFSIAIHSIPEILIIDEVLAVGDLNFQKKCFEKILQLKIQGVATIMVSHSASNLERFCDRGVLLDHGRQKFVGPIRECIKAYSDLMEISSQASAGLQPVYRGLGNISFDNVRVFGVSPPSKSTAENPSPDGIVEFGQDIAIEFNYKFLQRNCQNNQLRITIRSLDGRDVQKFIFQERGFLDGLRYANEKAIVFEDFGHFKIRIRAPRLFPQSFRVEIAVSRMDNDMHEGVYNDAAVFRIVEPSSPKLYFEYGNATLTEFDYELIENGAGAGHP